MNIPIPIIRIVEALKPWMVRFDGMSLRHRVGLAVASAAVLYFVLSVALLGQGEARSKFHQRRIDSQKTELENVRREIAILSSSLERDPNAEQHAQLADMKRLNAEAEAQLAHFEVATPAAGAFVREVLAATPGIDLVSLRTLPVTVAFQSKLAPVAPAKAVPVTATQAPGAKESTPKQEIVPRPPRSMYRHGVELSIKGNYLALLAYLEKLQHYPGRLYWGDLNLEVPGYPVAVLRLNVSTMDTQSNPRLGSSLR